MKLQAIILNILFILFFLASLLVVTPLLAIYNRLESLESNQRDKHGGLNFDEGNDI